MKKNLLLSVSLFLFLFFADNVTAQTKTARTQSFNKDWKFYLGDDASASSSTFNDATWRKLDLPHDWSIELPFDKNSPTGNGGGALRGGTGWYRKTFSLPASAKDRFVAITFDGVYRNSEVWINDHYLGKRPYGYSSFQYDLSPYLKFGNGRNVIAVKVDNSEQPNSRWYSGSGIYRNVWLTITNKTHVVYNGTFITTPEVNNKSANVHLEIEVNVPTGVKQTISATTVILNREGKTIAKNIASTPAMQTAVTVSQNFVIANPILWSTERPYLYKAFTQIFSNGKLVDQYTTPFGIRSFVFDVDKGFSLNGKKVKINGVCNHHDLGCLGAAINKTALRRQLQILKDMGVNGIRTSHNPPAPELLDLADEMGFIVMDEAFDMWKKEKTKFDYHLDWDEWHKKDLEDMVLRDRNHPSVFIWSIGNEIIEQWGENNDTSGTVIARELAGIVRALDATRPITSALNNPYPTNNIIKSGALDLIGYNYDHKDFGTFHERFPGKKFIATETVSSLATRGHYDMPSDSNRRWPIRWDKEFTTGNPDTTCSAYDNCSAPWGSTQEETWKQIKKYDFLSGQFIWTGFDYIGEPTPYPWPARSSYFGIVDLAGFPKDTYFMYQSEWTNKTVLHIFPHWNWKVGDTVDVWAYYSNADEVELFLNGKSLGIKRKTGDDLHVWWRVKYEPGTLKAVSRKNGKVVLTKEIKTAGAPAKIILTADRKTISGTENELCFVKATIVDKNGNVVPVANNLIHFNVSGDGFVAGTDNGCQTDLTSFKSTDRKAFNGLALAVLQSKQKPGTIQLTAKADGLQPASVSIVVK